MRLTSSILALATTLLLTTTVSAAPKPQDGEKKSAADYYVHDLPGVPAGKLPPKMHAGHITVDPDHNGNLFFWHFQNKHIAQRQRTVIWLNGGPGCSSMDGALMEVGPYRVKDEKTLEENPGSWHEYANLLFVDQPVGTGFSYVNGDAYLHELDEMANQFIIFLTKFFALFPEYETDDLYFAGESYAGQHIPYIAAAILKRNRDTPQHPAWNLRGLLIGNGWIDPEPQYLAYTEFAYKNHLITPDTSESKLVESTLATCKADLAKPDGVKVSVDSCEAVLQAILKNTRTKGDKGKNMCYNMYDIRLRDTYPSCGMNWPPDLVNVKPYLRRTDVTAALHVSPGKKTGWQECSGAVGQTFNAYKSAPAITLLPNILASGVEVLLFSGDKDFICNHLGTESSIHKLSWNGGTGFETSPGQWAPKEPWTFEGQPAGIYQSARNLTYVLVYNSSHMVPFDEPRRSRYMLDRFIGVDLSSIGGVPSESKVGGEKGPLTAIDAAPDSTAAEEKQRKVLEEERWRAYGKSGKIVLAVVVVAVAIWGAWLWRSRRKGRGGGGGEGWLGMGYKRVGGGEEEGVALEEGREWEVGSLEGERHEVGSDSEDDREERVRVGVNEDGGQGGKAKGKGAV